MKVGRGGGYKRDGKSMELFAPPDCSHSDLLELARDNFRLSSINDLQQKLVLFTLSGAVIVADEKWTLGSYLKKIKKSEAKLGIGYVDDEVGAC